MAIEPVIEPIVEPIGTVIRGTFGKGTPEQLIPAEGTPTHFNKYGAGPSWSDVYDWVKGRFVDDTSAPVQLNMPNVLDAILAGLQRLQEALSGFHNLAFDYTATVAAHVRLTLNFVERLIDVSNYHLQSQRDVDVWNAAVRENQLRADLQQTEMRLAQQIQASQQATIHALQGWTLASVAKPLTENLGHVDTNLTHLIDVKSLEAVGAAVSISAGPIARVASQLNAVRAAQTAAKAFQDECTQPMCQTMGPKTNLGKSLKGLSGLLGLLAGVSLAGLTERDLERIAAAFGAIGTGSLESFFHAFVEQGASIGGAGAALTGELTGAGTEVLRTLGVPI